MARASYNATRHNICGVLVHARPTHVPAVCARVKALPGLEVHAITGDGRVVTVIEDVPGHPAMDTLAALHDLDGVVSVSLVYHHFGTEQQGEN